MPNIPYDALHDFAPIAEVVSNTEVLVVNPKLGIKNAKQLVALAKRKPGAVTFASTGIGSPPHLTLVLFSDAAGVKFLHVPYRGAAPALTDLLGGHVQVFAADIPAVISQIRAGTVLPIAVAADERNPVLPNVPTLAEQGYPNTTVSNWYALLAPAKTPAPIIAKLNGAVNAALADPAVRQKLIHSGAVPVGGTAVELGAFMQAEYAKWGRVTAQHHITEAP
jgi:tripartite-type tricarboxylate transporter receptor subunit TctC